MKVTIQGTESEVNKVMEGLHHGDRCIFRNVYACLRAVDCKECPLVEKEILPWRAQIGEEFFVIDVCGKVRSHTEESIDYQQEYYDSKNYFQSKHKAELIAEKFRELLEGAHK